jgi:hypothetical protein
LFLLRCSSLFVRRLSSRGTACALQLQLRQLHDVLGSCDGYLRAAPNFTL